MSAPADDRPLVRGVEDRRRPAHGWGRLLVVVFAAFGLVVLVPSTVSLVRQPTAAPVVGSINVVAGLAPHADHRLDEPFSSADRCGAHRRTDVD